MGHIDCELECRPERADGSLTNTVLSSSFLLWAAMLFATSRKVNRREQMVYPVGTVSLTIVTVVACMAFWALFAFWVHGVLIGVSTFGATGSAG